MRTIHNHTAYQVVYSIIYLYLMINEAIKLAIFEKQADLYFNIVTCLACVIYATDIVFRSMFQDNYILKFFFFTDIVSIFLILGAAFAMNISQWNGLAFSKMIMVVRITDVVISYKDWVRSRKYKKKIIEERLKKSSSQSKLLNQTGAQQLNKGFLHRGKSILNFMSGKSHVDTI